MIKVHLGKSGSGLHLAGKMLQRTAKMVQVGKQAERSLGKGCVSKVSRESKSLKGMQKVESNNSCIMN